MPRFYMLAFTLLFAIMASESWCQGEEPLSLMTEIAKWQYPGSKFNGATSSDAATMNASGERTVPSVLCKTVLTTKDSMAKVIEYYKAKLKRGTDFATTKPNNKSGADPGRSVMFHDDSQGRPLGIYIILVNTDNSSTTLVISRAEKESETHIAWTRYIRLWSSKNDQQGR
ncbi:MAG: hypothetical protein JXM70_04310 [Pirellulales bacterium]|nr:hypothetical protein [Pirellulales bacterium]